MSFVENLIQSPYVYYEIYKVYSSSFKLEQHLKIIRFENYLQMFRGIYQFWKYFKSMCLHTMTHSMML